MKAATLVPVEEYLRTTYRPDCDYVDGRVLERNLGERDHSNVQGELFHYFRTRRRVCHAFAFIEQRVQVSAKRFRIPDVCVVLGPQPTDQILHQPPFICIEVLSKDDTLESMQAKIDDYLGFGVAYVWVINPRNRRAWVYTREAIAEAKDGILKTQNPETDCPAGGNLRRHRRISQRTRPQRAKYLLQAAQQRRIAQARPDPAAINSTRHGPVSGVTAVTARSASFPFSGSWDSNTEGWYGSRCMAA